MPCLFLTKDLLFSSRVEGAAKQIGVPLRILSSPDVPPAAAADTDTRLVLIDLTFPGLDVARMVSYLREQLSDRAGIVAFGPHVSEDALAAAREAGCDHVISRGEFNNRMADILRQACRKEPNVQSD